jgi:hypothetical protein
MSRAYFEEGSEAMNTLEGMVDKAGLRNVIYALAHICDAKADHVQSVWQDKWLSKEWSILAAKIDKFAHGKITGSVASMRSPLI